MSDQGNNRKKTAGGVTAAALVIAIGMLFSGGFGLLPGNGSGGVSGDGTQEKESTVETRANQEENDEEIPPTIVVSITENEVTINGHLVENEDELRRYVEDYNSDSRTFVLEEDQSILETYNWVKDVFTDLDIELKNSN
ncbi:MAG: hypothetical protein Q4D81_06725 [Eubacteriales bacterium]|nr:hypothetical protein [Eubacteriales bacterium]